MGILSTEAVYQEADIQPARRGEGMAITVDTTGRAYSLQLLVINGNQFQGQYQEHVYLDLQNDGANPIYYYFDQQGTTVDIAPATVQAAGSVLVASSVVPKVLRANQDAPVRINRALDKFLHLISTGGSSTLRIFPSSASSPKIQ